MKVDNIWQIFGLTQVILSLAVRGQDEVEFPDADVAILDEEDNYIEDYEEDYNYDYDEKVYDYELEQPALDLEEEIEEDILEDLDSVAMDNVVTLTLSEGTTTTSTTTTTTTTTTKTTTTSPPKQPSRNIFITLVIGGTGLSGSTPNIEVLPSAYRSYNSNYNNNNNLQRTIPSLPSVSDQSFYSAGDKKKEIATTGCPQQTPISVYFWGHPVPSAHFSLHWAGADDLHHRLCAAHPLWLDLQTRSEMWRIGIVVATTSCVLVSQTSKCYPFINHQSLTVPIAGTCYVMNVFSRSWQPTGGTLSLYRRHSSISRVGRYLLSVGGYRY